MQEPAAGRGEKPGDVERTAVLLETVFRLITGPQASALPRAGAGTALWEGFARLIASARGRERLRLMFVEDPLLVLWLEERAQGREVLATVELEFAMDKPHPEAAEDAARAAASPQQAAARRRWAVERRREWEEHQAYMASPAHLAARDRTHAAMMEASRRPGSWQVRCCSAQGELRKRDGGCLLRLQARPMTDTGAVPGHTETNVRLPPCALDALAVVVARRGTSRDETVRQLLLEHVEVQEDRDPEDRRTHISTVLRYPPPPRWRSEPRRDRPLRLRAPGDLLKRARAVSLQLPGQHPRAYRDYQGRALTDAVATAIAVTERFTDPFLEGLRPVIRHQAALGLWGLTTAVTSTRPEQELLIEAGRIRADLAWRPEAPWDDEEAARAQHLLLVATALGEGFTEMKWSRTGNMPPFADPLPTAWRTAAYLPGDTRGTPRGSSRPRPAGVTR